MQHITGFSLGQFLVRYLGTPLSYGKSKSCYFIPLIEKIADFINSWCTHNLSYAGRLELIKSVVQGIESLWIQNFTIPSTIIDRIFRLCRNFLWAGMKPKVAWEDICMPKSEGGLGLKKCKVWNKSMLLKVLWDINSNKNSLWIRWVHAVYLRGRSCWIWRHGRNDHPVFKNLMRIRDHLISSTGSVQNAISLLSSWAKDGCFSTSMAYDWLRRKKG